MKWFQVKKILDNMTEEQLDDPAMTTNDEGKLVELVGWNNENGHLSFQEDCEWYDASPDDGTPELEVESPE